MGTNDSASRNPTASPVGFLFLMREFDLKVPPPAVRSEVVAGARKTRVEQDLVLEQYPRSYLPDSLTGHLRFAMRYEPIDLGVLFAAFRAIGKQAIEDWVRAEPTGIFARRCWYLYELLTGQTLDVPDVRNAGYIDLLDTELHVTAAPIRVRRQRVNDNMLAGHGCGVLIRKTDALKTAMAAGLANEARAIVRDCDPSILARAVDYLFTKETKSSFAIEGEAPSQDRTERFVRALASAAEFDVTDKQAFIRLQNAIVDPRYAQNDWRTDQNYISQTLPDFSEKVHYVSPKPRDVSGLMTGWMEMASRLTRPQAADPVCAAVAVAFGFVYIHPFDDGNGRIHRFLVHHVFAKTGFTPRGLIFPVSAAMLRDRGAYDRVLARVSTPLLPLVDSVLDAEQRMTVLNETGHLYRYFDATPHAEYMYCCIEDTLRRDLKDEIRFLAVFDAAVRAALEVVDMPNRKATLLVKLILQNSGKLSSQKRGLFAELTDLELASIERAVWACKESG